MEVLGFPKPVTIKETNYERALRYQQKARLKSIVKKQKKHKKKRVRLPPLRALITKADRYFSLFIRHRDKKCVLCGATDNLTNGHLIKRGKKRVRWDELNCHCLCSRCNYRDNFDHDIYVSWFITQYGALPYQDLVEKSRGTYKPKRDELNEIIRHYSLQIYV